MRQRVHPRRRVVFGPRPGRWKIGARGSHNHDRSPPPQAACRPSRLSRRASPRRRPSGQGAVLRQLIDRQRAGPHPGRTDELGGCLDGRIGRGPADAEQQHAERRRQPVVRQRRAAQCRRRRTTCNRSPWYRGDPAADQWQQHPGGDAADAHHAQDHAIHARPQPRSSRTTAAAAPRGPTAGIE